MDERDVAQIAMKASGVARTGLMLKVGLVGGVLFLVALLLLGALAPAPTAKAATTCEDTGPGTGITVADLSTPATGSVHAQQLANAKTIDKVAKQLGLPGRATLIALMTAMQESTLQNLNYGHGDSIGLFQQQPSSKWGTRAQIMDPTFATQSFFQGRGGNEGLLNIPHWQTLPPGDVAQKVQKSAYPSLYAGHETAVRKLAKEAGIDLGRAGSNTGTSTNTTPLLNCLRRSRAVRHDRRCGRSVCPGRRGSVRCPCGREVCRPFRNRRCVRPVPPSPGEAFLCGSATTWPRSSMTRCSPGRFPVVVLLPSPRPCSPW
ncbi:hypothetical protein [Streptomyces noursei]|uniref:hypothetical protein n=1 Tax=Streptomyces noursei TaxID=1971 RepID=UPI0022A691E9|nr:hypothetical protein [Streptomyces noursei]MCZ1021394.1 hypothetical protein [Streptomyces noursei]